MTKLRLLEINELNAREVIGVLDPVLGNVISEEIVLSRACAHMLLQSVAALASKKAEQKILSSSTVTFVTLSLARIMARTGGVIGDGRDRIGDETDRLRAWGLVLEGPYGALLDTLAADFFEKMPKLDQDDDEFLSVPAPVDAKCSERLAIALKTLAAEAGVVRIDALILHLIDDGDTRIAGRLQAPETQEIADALREATATLAGRSPTMVREAASTELALRIEDHALALATVLRSAEGEFTFALLGPWGSGKTTLTKVMKPLLESPEAFQKAAKVSGQAFAEQSYAVVFHNAWKYRSRPECWLFAYRSLAEAASSRRSAIERTLLSLRTSILRKGPWPLTAALLGLAVLAIPFSAKVHLAIVALSTTGFGVVYLALVMMRAKPRVQDLYTHHLRLSPVDEKLGMLALVGDDIRALLAAWTRPHPDKNRSDSESACTTSLVWTLCVLGLFGVVWLTGIMGWWSVDLTLAWLELIRAGSPTPISDSFSEQSVSAQNSSTFIELGVFVSWVLLSLSLMVLPWFIRGDQPDRVLMVIDDLDRCSPEEMLDVIEGMRLLVDSEDVNRKLQILMLVDESVLNHGIALRYETMIHKRVADKDSNDDPVAFGSSRDDVIAEQKEKLFACHLRIASLTKTDIETLIGSLAGAELQALKRSRLKKRRALREEEIRKLNSELKQAEAQLEAAKHSVGNARDPKPVPMVDVYMEEPAPRSVRSRRGYEDAYGHPSQHTIHQRETINKQAIERNQALKNRSPEQKQADIHAAEIVQITAESKLDEIRRRLEYLSGPLAEGGLASARETPFDNQDVRFTAVEIEQLQRLVPEYLSDIGRRPSPRAIRTLLFKIQLYRLLLQLRYPWHPKKTRTIETILTSFRAASKPPCVNGDPEDDAIRIARQVV